MATSLLVVAVVYRIVLTIVGFGFALLGYRLFSMGVFGPATDVSGGSDIWRLTIKNAAPGTVFALFGAAIIVISMVRPLSSEIEAGDGADPTQPYKTTVLLF
ncbi:MAG: hypothetical protein ACYTG0_15345 [Planctomycetota bacterium]|jgi:hypothetical protein